jgi:CRP/FNR family transcriptional regulator
MAISKPINLKQYFPFLAEAGPEVERLLIEQAVVKELPAGELICWEGDTCTHLAVVLSGSVRVYKVGESGREITLYRIEAAESCILTASCILSQVQFPAIAVVEQPVEAILIPAYILRQWVERYVGWRDYVFALLSQRLSMVIATVEEVAFRRVDVRLAELLLELSAAQPQLQLTHQALAFELGTAREVVSRILKDFEREKLIALGRGTITVLNRAALLDKKNLL